MKTQGVAFEDLMHERIERRVGADSSFSAEVRALCRFGMEAEAELAQRGIHIDDPEERAAFLLDRLAEGLDAWNA